MSDQFHLQPYAYWHGKSAGQTIRSDGNSRGLGQSGGFTLIELLVALSLLGLLFLLLMNGTYFGTHVWGTSEKKQSDASQDLAVENLLRRLFSEARPIIVRSEETVRPHVFFFGTEHSVRFVAPMLEYLGMGGFYEVTVYLTSGGTADHRVEVSWRLFRHAGADSNALAERRVTVLNNVADIQFAYFGDPEHGDKGAARWYSDWHDLPYFPELVRLRVKFTRDGRRWPDLVIAPMVQTVNVQIPVPEDDGQAQ